MYLVKESFKCKSLWGDDIKVPKGSIMKLDGNYFVRNGVPICSKDSFIAEKYIVEKNN